jgi:hypothetical protein
MVISVLLHHLDVVVGSISFFLSLFLLRSWNVLGTGNGMRGRMASEFCGGKLR